MGKLEGFTVIGRKTVFFNLHEPVGRFLYPDEAIALMCAAASFLFFRIQGEVASSLLVFNICGSSCRRIECPPQFFTDFAFGRIQDVKIIMNPQKVYVEHWLGGVLYYEYDSKEERWTHLGLWADEVYNLLNVELGDRREMVMVLPHPPSAFLVCFGGENNGPVFTNPFVHHLIDFHQLHDPNACSFK